MTDRILFLCPHNAAKSVIAAEYLNRMANDHGLDIRADSAGTEPEPAVYPFTVDLLYKEGIDVTGFKPRPVTPGDLEQAAHVISMGCDLSGQLPDSKITYWSDVPPVSQQPDEAARVIRDHIADFLEEWRQESG